ncbi:DUF1054 domain-containing protein [Alicyclobacillus cycloheptanicus]|uniref:UPF0637 protein J2S03_002621 n=1 Tax=Alicyclobacillus cycloheptanicus TaxID=1457 RepID=A0ABT9XKD3_9BACL|nr:DUF1054 domain-containing protein [Alicyclobacillus cycloheptanicus]MDQ0190754.1 uncharacterized protein YktB (UPF0637 family) [Alicyclobacillus cycloheptanicus]WDL99860.1 DUF1054 domain-containing protein [Alicyclobacillus cycloheptanicus]
MRFSGFSDEDFEVFAVPGLEPRMAVLKSQLRPKLEALGADFSAYLSDLLGRPMFAHVAKHARRTVNPPDDSWVAFCEDKRGYKKHPHFQIGLWRTHVFATFGLIYESPVRAQYAEQLVRHADEVLRIVPPDYVWIPNHMDPNALSAAGVDEARLRELADRLKGRQGELLVGLKVDREQAVQMTAGDFEQAVQQCFANLAPLFRLAAAEVQAL